MRPFARAAVTDSPLTAIVLTRNERENIAACVSALRFASRVLVVDSESDDGTAEAAKAAGAEVVVHPFRDYASQRNFALGLAETEWILMVDADETVPEALASEIARAIRSASPGTAAFRIPRDNRFLGRVPRGFGWGRDHVVRLLRRGRVRFANVVHEAAVVDGTVASLLTPLDHRTIADLGQTLEKTVRYAALSAREMHSRGRRTSLLGILGHTLARAIKVYVVRRGFVAGVPGLVVTGLETAGVFFKYALLWERGRSGKDASVRDDSAGDSP